MPPTLIERPEASPTGHPRRWWASARRVRPERTSESVEPREDAPPPSARILLVNQHYWPDHASTAQHLTDLAEALAEAGHEVHVLCSRRGSRPDTPPRPASEERKGVRIHRVGATGLGRRSTLRRMADYLSFHASAASKAVRLPRFDVVVTLTTPPLIGVVGSLLRRFRGSAHIAWSMDLHPDASIALGSMSSRNPIVTGLAWVSDSVARGADRVVALGPYMADRLLAKRVRPGRLVTIPVWSRREEIVPVSREANRLRESLGFGDRFLVMYSGNVGLAHTFEDFLEAARLLRDRPEILFLFAGDGPRLREVLDAKAADGLENLRRLESVPRDRVGEFLGLADVHLISLRPEMAGISVPGKLYGAMAAGRPTLFVGPEHCETADAIREAECGLTFRLGEAARLAEAIRALADDPELAASLGGRARAGFEADYERRGLCDRWIDLIGSVVRPPIAAGHRQAGAGFARNGG